MKPYLANRWFKLGLLLVVFGWGPLWGIVFLAAIGLWPDPEPNPIGPGLLFFVTAWPAIICLGVGVLQVKRDRGQDPPSVPSHGSPPAGTDPGAWRDNAMIRFAVAGGGVFLIFRGAVGLGNGAGRGAAAMLVLGALAVYWALARRVPSWVRR
jgi:hypothetical protein